MIANEATNDTTATVALSSIDLVRRWENDPEVPEQVRRAVFDGVREIVTSGQQMPFAQDHLGGLRLMMQLLIARFRFTRREAQSIIGWYELDQTDQF